MSVDDEIPAQQVLGEDEEEILSGLAAQLETSCQQLDLDALRGAGELLRRETNSLKTGSSQQRTRSRLVAANNELAQDW